MLSAMMASCGWLLTPAGVNALFALVCAVAAMGAPARAVMWLSALLYAAMVMA